MADNYLEKRYEEVFGRGQAAGKSAPARPSLDKLLSLLRDCTEYDNGYAVHPLQMEAILGVLSRHPAPDGFRFISASGDNGIESCPEACIVALYDGAADKDFAGSTDAAIRLGAAIENLRLKAIELGLSSSLYTRFDKEAVKRSLGTSSTPVAVIGIGKAAGIHRQ